MTTLSLHPERAALLADIVQNRHDLTPRLVYADWLEDHADTMEGREEDWRARAEFIRLQCRLELACRDIGLGTLPIAKEAFNITTQRESFAVVKAESLLARHRHAWLDDEFRRAGMRGDFYAGGTYAGDLMMVGLSGGDTNTVPLAWKWHAGFPDHLRCAWPLWDAIGDRLHAGWPVTEVEITGAAPVVQWSVENGWRRFSKVGDRATGVVVSARDWQDGFVRTADLNDRSVKNLLATHWPGVRFAFSPPVT